MSSKMSSCPKLFNFCIDMSETDLCRVCLNDSHSYSHIFEEMLLGDYLYEVLNDVCQLQVKVDDDLPAFVCCECYKRISEFGTFKRQSHEGNAALQRMKCDLGNVQVKVEAGEYEDDPLGEEYMNENDIGCPVEVQVKMEADSDEDESFREEYMNEDDVGCPVEVSNVPACLHEEDVINCEAEWRNQGYSEPEINIKEEVEEEESFGKREKLGFNLEVCATPSIQRDSSGEDSRQSAVCEIGNCVDLKENVEVYKEYRMERTRINEYVGQNPEGNLSNCEEYGGNFGQDDGQMQFSGTTNKRKTVNNSNLGTVSKPTVKLRNVDVESDKPGMTLKGTDTFSNKNMGKVKRFMCDTCERVFRRKGDLVVHVRVHTGEKPYKCSICSRAFMTMALLRRHSVIHNYGGSHVCSVCGKSFKEDSYLKEHLKTCSERGKFCCMICNKICTTQRNLNIHLRLHSDYNPFPCITCGMTFKCKSTFHQHLISHSDALLYHCDICGKGFAKEGALKRHRGRHSDSKSFSCSICNVLFKSNNSLKRHMCTHNGIKPFKCSTCDKDFSSKMYLQSHMKSHSTEKPFPCPNCGKYFKYKYDIGKHLKFSCKGK